MGEFKAIEGVAAVLASSLSSTDKAVAVSYVMHANAVGQAWPGAPRVAAQCSMNERTVRRARGKLEALGVLVPMSKGVGRAPRYTVRLEALPARTPDTGSGVSQDKPRTQDPPTPDTGSEIPRTQDPPTPDTVPADPSKISPVDPSKNDPPNPHGGFSVGESIPGELLERARYELEDLEPWTPPDEYADQVRRRALELWSHERAALLTVEEATKLAVDELRSRRPELVTTNELSKAAPGLVSLVLDEMTVAGWRGTRRKTDIGNAIQRIVGPLEPPQLATPSSIMRRCPLLREVSNG